jgi:hypothetical protein
MWLGFNHIDKFDFLEAYPKARTAIFSADNIKSDFSATGSAGPVMMNMACVSLSCPLQ